MTAGPEASALRDVIAMCHNDLSESAAEEAVALKGQPGPEPEPEPEGSAPAFIACDAFSGPKPGYVYGARGDRLGYHADDGGATASAGGGSAGAEGKPQFLDFEVPVGSTVGSTIFLPLADGAGLLSRRR